MRGDSSDPEFQMADQPAPDQFDDWSANRDRTLLASQSYQHVSRDIYGADDLDAYGNWVPSQYGNVWTPRSTGADWAPYSTGHWVWEDYYGWTWVDDAAWGWAPYHYGRWFQNPGYGWCWWPGSIASSYFWSPALVGFFGWGGGDISVGWGGIGWVALAPFETFHPWWGHGFHGGRFGRGYGNYTNINIVRNTNITNIYRNASVRGAAITAHGNDFGHGGSARFGRATPVQLRSANLFRGQMPVTPTRASRQFSNRQATPNPRLAAVANRHFYQSPRVAQLARASSGRQQMGTQPGSRVAGNTVPLARSGGFARAGQPGFSGAQAGTQRQQAPAPSRGNAPRTLQNSRNGDGLSAVPQRSLHGMPPNTLSQTTRSQTGGRSSVGPRKDQRRAGTGSGKLALRGGKPPLSLVTAHRGDPKIRVIAGISVPHHGRACTACRRTCALRVRALKREDRAVSALRHKVRQRDGIGLESRECPSHPAAQLSQASRAVGTVSVSLNVQAQEATVVEHSLAMPRRSPATAVR